MSFIETLKQRARQHLTDAQKRMQEVRQRQAERRHEAVIQQRPVYQPPKFIQDLQARIPKFVEERPKPKPIRPRVLTPEEKERAQKIKEFGKAVLRDFPRSVVQLQRAAHGIREELVPETRIQKFLLGEEPVKHPEEAGFEMLRGLGVEEERARRLGGAAGYPLAVLGAIPVVPGRRKIIEEGAKKLAEEVTEVGAKPILQKILPGVDEKRIDDLAKRLAPIKDQKIIQKELDDFVEKAKRPGVRRIQEIGRPKAIERILKKYTPEEEARIMEMEIARDISPFIIQKGGRLFQDIKELGGIKSYRDGFMAEELREIPIRLRNNQTGSKLDEMADMLRNRGYDFQSDGDLLDAISKIETAKRRGGVTGETFILDRELRKKLRAEIRVTQQEARLAEIARQKAVRLDMRQQKIRQDAIENIHRFRGNTDNIAEQLRKRHLSDEDIANVILEDGTKLVDTVKVKRNIDGSLATTIKRSELEDIARNYADEVPVEKWTRRSILVEGIEMPVQIARFIAELPRVFFERKGLTSLYDPIIQAGRGAQAMRTYFIEKFKDAGLLKRAGLFTSDRFDISKNEAEGIARYYLGRQGRGPVVALENLSEKGKKFVEVFDSIIKETESTFFEMARKMGKRPGKVPNYAPLMTSADIRLVDERGAMEWLYRNHPAFFSLKERMKQVPIELYDLDYRRVATKWLDGMADFLNYSEPTNHLKYLINSDQFKALIKESDWQTINKWLRDVTTPEIPATQGEKSINALSRLLRFGVSMGALGLNYATVIKQALSIIPVAVIEKAAPKLKSNYARAFGINVADLPSVAARRYDISIADFQGKIRDIFMGPLAMADKKVAQALLNGLLDKEYTKFLKEGAEITPRVRAIIEKRAQDAVDLWMGGFFRGQRPEAFRRELGNFILMFIYPLTSQLNGFLRHIFWNKSQTPQAIRAAEVMAAAIAIAYAERTIERLSPMWSDKEGMTQDILLALAGNIPLVGNFVHAIAHDREFNISPVLGNLNNIIRGMAEKDYEQMAFTFAESIGVPRQFRRVKEGMEIMEAGGITDKEGNVIVPVQDTIEIVRSLLRGRFGSLAARDWVGNIGVRREERRWFIPEVEFLQNGDYARRAELYLEFMPEDRAWLRNFLSEAQQARLDNALARKEAIKTGIGEEEIIEIERRLDIQRQTRDEQRREAEAEWQRLQNIKSDEEYNREWTAIVDRDRGLAKRIKNIAEEQRLGLGYDDRIIKDLGVDNWERARYLHSYLMNLPDDQYAAEWQDLVNKRIITREVKRQIEALMAGQAEK